MNAEIVAVGTELLLGQIPNTNAQQISVSLAEVGVNVFFHTVVGDNLPRMSDTLRTAAARSDCVVITGGLGPTPDDVTREGVAQAFGLGLSRRDDLARAIAAMFEALGREMPSENLRQADLPDGARPIAPEGTAPGFALEHGGTLLFALPGVPWEMRAMLDKAVVPELRRRTPGAIVSRQVLVIGLGESHTHEKIRDVVEAQTNPTVAFLAGGGQVRVRITAKATTEEEAVSLIAPVEERVRDALGPAAVSGVHESLAHAVVGLLGDRGLRMGAAESLTGGLIGAEITKVAGASDVFAGSLVTYDATAKQAIARVPREVLDATGPVSEETASALAEGAAGALEADLAVSATGVAGPEAHGGHPVGTIFVAAAFGGRTEVRRIRGYGDRSNIRALAVTAALDLARRALEALE